MKKTIGILFFILLSHIVSGQNINAIEKQLELSFQKIGYWYADQNHNRDAADSLMAANNEFEKLLLKHTSNPQTLKYDFKSLRKNGLQVSSSEDGKFRIYSWDTWNGGTMHFFKNIFQYEADNKVYSEIIGDNSEMNPQTFYYKINDIISENKKYYLAQNMATYSSALTSHSIKVFSIDNGKLNSDARLIKTKTGIRNQLGYEIDLAAKSNWNNEIENYDIEYDAKKKIISIPLILDDYKVTDKKIRYQFTGKYFEKI
ncbi:hypothetical protein [Chryseobacterium sp. JV558]|uniref:hypothetical protein n=1 Tax=Chryseobacterium sp. JV558 TaxID=2663236 RepID=UPI00299EA4FD|nr:hypothetical protein [Chryseobacterium sp. JV558]MDW9379934.1 hypothetical protein [Chryseobacterium sp. JV558]